MKSRMVMGGPLLVLAFVVLSGGCQGRTECECSGDECDPHTIWVVPPGEDGRAMAEDLVEAPDLESLDELEWTGEAEVPGDLAGEEHTTCPLGTACNPIPVPELPFQDSRDGALGPADEWDFYSPCGPTINESGPEWVYELSVPEAGVLHVGLDEDPADDVDMDVHLLSALDPNACLNRAHAAFSQYVEPGTYYVVVDTWVDDEGVEYPGPYTLDIFIQQGSILPEEAGFNKYVVEAINDWSMFPKDSSYFFCYNNPSCEPDWVDIYFGMIHDTYYLGEFLFEGTQRCYCCGHTLEIFLDAYRRYQEDNGVAVTVPYGALTVGDVDLGHFYQHWFGWGVGATSSSANALEYAGIGMNINPADWELAITGDFVNISRSNGTGHAVIFVNWVTEGDDIVGLRYYGCNGSGDSHPDPAHPDNVSGVSGPSFVTEYFVEYGGKVLPGYVFIGRPFWPPNGP